MPLYLGDNLISGMGLPGKSAYEQAKEAGYAGTEEEFIELLTNAAPAGYGLGETEGRTISSLDEIDGYGFYRIPSETGLAPDSSSNWGAVYIGSNINYGKLFVSRQGAGLYSKSRTAGVWEDGWVKVYDENNKPTAADVGAVKKTGDTMTGNLSIEKTSPVIRLESTDDNTLGTMAHGSNRFYIQAINNADSNDNRRQLQLVNSTASPSIGGALRLIDIVDGKSGVIYYLYGEHNKPTPEALGAVKKTGDTMTGALEVAKTSNWGQFIAKSASGYYRAFEADDTKIRLDVRDTDSINDRRFLDIANKTGVPDVANAILFYDRSTSGQAGTYKIYGEHNVTAGTTDLTAGSSALGTGCIHFVYE